MKVAAIQMVSATTLSVNLTQADTLLHKAAQAGAELAVLPEYFCLLGRKDTDKLNIQEPFGNGVIQQFLADAARRFKLWIVGGTLPIAVDGHHPPGGSVNANPHPVVAPGSHVYNSSLAFSPDGVCAARYDKIHLFRFNSGQEAYDETRVLLPGTQPTVFELTSRDGQVWRIGMSVCYDLRFPELYRGYAQTGVDMLLVPSAFTHTTGQAHWDVLLRARAIENQAFVVAAAQGGLHENGRRTWGHTMLVDPWGGVIAQLPEGAGVVCQDLQLATRDAASAKLPALNHRVL